MAFFDDIGKKISDVSQSTIQKGRDMADIAKYNSLVSDEEKKITEIYTQIGKLYVEKHKDSPEEDFKEHLDAIKSSEDRLEEYRDRLMKLRGVRKCTACGADVPSGSMFCTVCGNQLETPAAAEVHCPACGALIMGGNKFCTSCGEPISG